MIDTIQQAAEGLSERYGTIAEALSDQERPPDREAARVLIEFVKAEQQAAKLERMVRGLVTTAKTGSDGKQRR